MRSIRQVIYAPFVLLGLVFGRIKWSMPPWLDYLNKLGKKSPARLLLLLLLLATIIFSLVKAFEYYQNLPQVRVIEALITPPDVPAFENDSAADKINPLQIEFLYSPVAQSVEVTEHAIQDPEITQLADFPSVAPIAKIGEPIGSGIKLSPAKAGNWQWRDDRTLEFIPENHWPAGQEYQVNFAPEVFDTKEAFSDTQYIFTTPEMQVELGASEFELSAQENRKQVFVEYLFSHPVDKESLEKSIKMAYLLADNKTQPIENYSVYVSENLLSASVMMPVDQLPEQSQVIEIKLKPGVRTILGGEGTKRTPTNKIVIPDAYSYLKVDQVSTEILRNQEKENLPEQFIMLTFTDAIEQSELFDKLAIYALPNETEDGRPKYWQSPRELTEQTLQGLQTIDFTVMPNLQSASQDYQLRIKRKENEQLYVRIEGGLRSSNGFIQRAYFDKIVLAPEYPKEVLITGEGSVLAHSDNLRLPFLTRGIEEVQVTIAKVKDNQLNHLVSQTRGDISNPDFQHWSFNEQNLAEFTSQFVRMNAKENAVNEASYASVDFNELIRTSGQELGLFFIKISAWDTARNRIIYGVEDTLLLLVTNLGVIIKANNDQSQDVFVQSIKTGKPVANASVQLLGKNGVPLFTKKTNQNGHSLFPSVSGYSGEKQPTVFVVTHQDDVSFIPFNRFTRQINYSRFDVGGTYNYYADEQALKGYLFTDRGIYRPGERVNIGVIVKSDDFSDVDNIPLELVIRDAQYKEIETHKVSLPQSGFFEHKLDTHKRFVTGNYTASLHLVSSNRFQRALRDRQIGFVEFSLEEFQADTMSNATTVDGVSNKGWTSQKELSATVAIENLFGVPAQDRRVSAKLNISPINFTFDAYSGYQFNARVSTDKTSDDIQSLSKGLADEISDAEGIANFPLDFTSFDRGTYLVELFTEGFEASGGRSVKGTHTFLFSPSEQLMGLKKDGELDFVKLNSDRSVNLVAINNELERVALENLSVRLSEIKTVSTLVKQYNGRYEYQSSTIHNEVSTKAFSVDSEETVYNVKTDKAGKYVVEFMSQNGHSLSAFEYTVVGENNLQAALDKDAELNLTLNKSDYKSGESIEVSIQAPYAGNGLITIESNQVHTYQWFSTETTNTVQRIRIPETLEGNAYVNVSFVRDHASQEIFTSPLSYAVAPFSIDKDKRTIDLSINIPDVALPGHDMPINIDVSDDTKLLVYAADIGILQVANYKTPNPLSFFLQKRALSVRTMQIMDLILPSFELVRRLSAAGGDMAEAMQMDASEKIMVSGSRLRRTENPFARKVNKPVVYWSGVIDAQKGNNSLSFSVPEDFAGGLRFMAIAVNDNAIGRAQASNLVVGPFVISPNVLKQAAPNDEFQVTLSVANLVEDSGDDAKVGVQLITSEHLQVVGDNNAELRLSEGQEGSVDFLLKAGKKLGPASLKFTVSVTDKRGETWLGSRTASMSVRPASPYEVNIDVGASADGEVKVTGSTAFYEDKSRLSLSASTSPLLIAEGLSAYLDSYPYGCTEQMVSQVFPLIGLSNLNSYSTKQEEVIAHFDELIQALRQRQRFTGSFSYWPAQQQDDLSTSIYVMHFLLEAQTLNFPVPKDMLQSGISYLDNTMSQLVSRNASLNSEKALEVFRERAHVIYLLTRSGRLRSNLIIDLIDELNNVDGLDWQEDISASYIAASYSLMQQKSEANKLINKYRYSKAGKRYKFAFGGEVNGLIFDAQHIYLLAKHFPNILKNQAQDRLSETITEQIASPIFKGEYNTISAAYSILALGAYHGAIEQSSATDEMRKIDEQIRFIATTAAQKVSEIQPKFTPFATVDYPLNSLQIKAVHGNDQALYFVDLKAGFEKSIGTRELVQGLEIQRTFLNSDNQTVTSADIGDELTVRLRVRSIDNRVVSDAAITDLLPAGFEVIRESIRDVSDAEKPRPMSTWDPSYIDIREDRIVYFGPVSKQVSEIFYRVKVTAVGRFVVPPSLVESMYDRNLKGRSAAFNFEVLRPSSQERNDGLSDVK